MVHVSTCPTHMASAPTEASIPLTSPICPARKSPVVSFLYKSSLPTETATNQSWPYCFTAANSAAFSALKWSAFCDHTPARIFTPVAKDAGTAFTSVSQSEDAYSRAESNFPGKANIARKSASQSDWVLQPPSGRWEARLKPLQWAWVREEKARRGARREQAKFFIIFFFGVLLEDLGG